MFGLQPRQKSEGAGYHNNADTLNRVVSLEAAIAFVRRLTIAAITGNGAMHLKHWSLIYPGYERSPKFAPVYEVFSTIPYLPADTLALSLRGEKSFKALTQDRWRTFANRLPEGAVLKSVAETATMVHNLWSTLPDRDVVPKPVLELIDNHIAAMAPILDPAMRG